MPSQSEHLSGIGLPQPDQIGFVVRDLATAIDHYTPLFGTFQTPDFGIGRASYHGQEPSSYEMKFAFAKVGDLEIELIQWVSGDTPHRDFQQQGREGMHHLRYRIDDFDHWSEKLLALGYDLIWFDRASPQIAYGYFERPGDPLLVELLQFPGTLSYSAENEAA